MLIKTHIVTHGNLIHQSVKCTRKWLGLFKVLLHKIAPTPAQSLRMREDHSLSVKSDIRRTRVTDNESDSSSCIAVNGFQQISSLHEHAPVLFSCLDLQVHLAVAQFFYSQCTIPENS